jgi:hypothetical protein
MTLQSELEIREEELEELRSHYFEMEEELVQSTLKWSKSIKDVKTILIVLKFKLTLK